jgi:hypothetical protein
MSKFTPSEPEKHAADADSVGRGLFRQEGTTGQSAMARECFGSRIAWYSPSSPIYCVTQGLNFMCSTSGPGRQSLN